MSRFATYSSNYDPTKHYTDREFPLATSHCPMNVAEDLQNIASPWTRLRGPVARALFSPHLALPHLQRIA